MKNPFETRKAVQQAQLPATPARDPAEPEVIISTVREVNCGGARFRVWDDPVGRWLRTADSKAAEIIVEAFTAGTKLTFTICGSEAVKVEKQ